MKRIFGIDLVRSVAVFLVLSVHFFLNNGFYDHNINCDMFPSIIVRWIFYTGVPLFILITGYLKKDKGLDKSYYKSIIKIIVSYLFVSVLCVIFKKFILHEHTRILSLIISIFDFTANGYSWYIEMYIGLFLLIPFLNILYNNLKNKADKQKLILTFGLLVSISPLINYLQIDGIKINIIPDWWGRLYPLMYYFIGCYIKDYGIKINKIKGFLIFIGIIILESVCSFLYNYNNPFSWDFLGGYGSLLTVISSTSLFLILYDIKCDNRVIKYIFTEISILSLDIYLFSFIVDSILYSHLGEYISSPMEYLKYYIPIIFVVFMSSFILSYLKKILFDTIIKLKKIVNH